MTHDPSAPQPQDDPRGQSAEALRRPLARLRGAARRLLVLREAAWIAACVLGTVLALGLIDYVLRMPVGMRLAFWLIGVGALVVDVRRRLIPAWRFNPPLSEIALRVERTPEAGSAGLRGVLASGLELAAPADARGGDAGLTDRVVGAARSRLAGFAGARAVLAPRSTQRSVALALIALLPVAGLVGWQADLGMIGLRRVLTPWTSAAWPKRTGVSDATGIRAHPLGAAVPLKAVISWTQNGPGKTDVWAIYRLVDGEHRSASRRALLTGQGRSVEIAPVEGEGTVRGELYERLVEPAGMQTGGEAGATPSELTLEYWFETEDDRTAPARIALVEPPAVVSAALVATLPPYAAGAEGFVTGTRDLGNGRDERASAAPLLAGSRLALRLTLNKPLGAAREPGEAFPGVELPADAALAAEGSTWTLSWTAERPLRLPVQLTDEHGITADRDAAFQFGVIADRAPAAAVVEPAQDESVLSSAVISAAGEGRDDVGLSWAALEMQIARPPAASEGAPPEASGPPTRAAQSGEGGAGAPARQIRVTSEVDLSTLSLKARDEVWLTALAKDSFESGGAGHEPARSSVRRLRIIAESELVEQVRGELSGVRQAALRLDQDQAEVARRGETSIPAEVRPAQEGLTQRIAPQGEIVKRIAGRVARNNLVDRALTGLLEDSAGALSEAERASAQAGRALEQAERAGADAPTRERLAHEAADAQRRVRDQLGRLISMLDRGQDGYTVRREVQRMIEDQRRLMEQTKDLGEQTRGKRAEEVQGAQRDQLSQLADQQAELSRRAAQMVSDMAQRSVNLQKQDPALAQALAKSAQRARQDRVPDKQQQAAEQIKQNQTGSAGESQQEAMDSLQKMMEELDQTEKQRDEALKRVLEDAIASIQALIESQEREINALDRAMPDAKFAGLDAGMIRLHADTLGVADKIRSAFRELASVADQVDGAGRAQSTAVSILRAQSPDGPEALQAERQSRERLRAAKAEAERLRRETENKDQSRKRDELKKAYQEALEAQVALHGRTVPLVGKELDRRQRAGVRGLGEQQVQIRTRLTVLRDQNAGIGEAKLFDYAHTRLDEVTGRAGAALGEGTVTAMVDRDQTSAVRLLQSLVEALKDAKARDFRDSPGSDDGGGGGGSNGNAPLIMPIAQLRLLRLMQQDVADLTRAAEDERIAGRADAGAVVELSKMQAELAKRAQELLEQAQGPGPEDKKTPEEKRDHNPGASFGFEPPKDQPPATSPAPKPEPAKEPEKEPAKDQQEPPKDRPGDTLPSLDELLGLPKTGDPKAPAGPDSVREELERRLAPEEAEGAQAELLVFMHRAAQRLEALRDAGVETQRAQADAIKRIDQLIDMAERNQQKSQQKKPKPDQQPQRQQQTQQQSQAQNTPSKGDNRSVVNPPGREDAALKPPAPGAGARWGSLPEHIRNALQQGMSDPVSSLYRSMTEEYYKRLAEEPRPAGAPR